MYKIIQCFRFLGLFPRRLRDSSRELIGGVSMPFLLHSVALMALKIALLSEEIRAALSYFGNHAFIRALSLSLWSLCWAFSIVFIILTFVFKHEKLCHLVESIHNFHPLTQKSSLSKYQKIVILIRIICHLTSAFIYLTPQSPSFFKLYFFHSSFVIYLSLQIFSFVITNNLSKILKAVIHEDGRIFFERVRFDSLARHRQLRLFRKYLRKIHFSEILRLQNQENKLKSTFMVTKFVDELITLASDVLGGPVLVYLLYCLIGLTLTMYNLIVSASTHSHLEILDYTAYCVDFTATPFGFADLSNAMNDEVRPWCS